MTTNALVKVGDVSKNDELIQLVSFMLAEEEYGVEVLKVREIIRMPTITKMPNTPQYVEGIINLRNQTITLLASSVAPQRTKRTPRLPLSSPPGTHFDCNLV